LASRAIPLVRVVRTINGMGWVYSSRSPLALALRPVQRALHRRASRMTDITVFQNSRDKAFFEQNGLVTRERSILIPGSGVDVARFDDSLADGPAAERLRAELGLGNAPVVVTVTRLTRQKGIPTLLKAAQRVHCLRPEVRFLLVGPRESEGRLAVSQRELDRHSHYVIATGPRDDVPALLRMADIFAFPTEYREGVPRALLEAALAGLPIVTTNMPGCDDVVHNGRSGLLVPPRAPRLLAEGIMDLLADRVAAKNMGCLASTHVRQNFGLQLTVARYREVYRTILDSASVASSLATASMSDGSEAGAPLPHRLVFSDRV
jgi:glycosyltransferase involved in cell wall biosynthesis